LQLSGPARRRLADYEWIADRMAIERARDLAAGLGERRVLYLGSAPGEAADPAPVLLPLVADLGVAAERAVLHGDAEFSEVARGLSDALRGAEWPLPAEAWGEFHEACEAAAVAFDLRRYDVIVAFGAAAAALIDGRRSERAQWIWRTWTDASRPDQRALDALAPVLGDYGTLVFAAPEFALPDLDERRVRVIPGAIDPLAPIHRELEPGRLGRVVAEVGIDPSRPLVCALTRLDGWTDPLAAIESWRLARQSVEGLQLAIAGHIDPGDPEGAGIVAEIEAFASGIDDIHVLTNWGGASEEQLGAVQAIARCQLHCPIAEGFDPWAAAAAWKGTPLVRAPSNRERAEQIVLLASDPGRAVRMGRLARRRARAEHSIVRLLADELELLGPAPPPAERSSGRAARAAA
jgi:hypothetical protein